MKTIIPIFAYAPLLTVLLSSCASIPIASSTISSPYKNSKFEVEIKGARATMVIVNDTPYQVNFQIYKNADNCSEPAGNAIVFAPDRLRLAFPADDSVAFTASYSYRSGTMTNICTGTYSFKPLADAIYKTEITAVPNICIFKTSESVEKGNREYQDIPVHITTRTTTSSFLSGGACKSLKSE